MKIYLERDLTNREKGLLGETNLLPELKEIIIRNLKMVDIDVENNDPLLRYISREQFLEILEKNGKLKTSQKNLPNWLKEEIDKIDLWATSNALPSYVLPAYTYNDELKIDNRRIILLYKRAKFPHGIDMATRVSYTFYWQ